MKPSSVQIQLPGVATLLWTACTSSTNNLAKLLVGEVALPLIVVAAQQSAGRGRGEKTWWSPPGCLMVSCALSLQELELEREKIATLSTAFGAIVAETLVGFLGEDSRAHIAVRPPNDIFYSDLKLAGILIESPTPQHVIVGIGINVNNAAPSAPTEVAARGVTSICDIAGTPADADALFASLIGRCVLSVWGRSAPVALWYT